MNKYYVYIYYVIDTNEVFYVGKGTKNRAFTGKRNKFCEDMKSSHEWSVRIIEDNMSESEAFDLEIKLIKEFKNKGRLTNQTDGGDGISGYIMTEEIKNKISQSSKKTLAR